MDANGALPLVIMSPEPEAAPRQFIIDGVPFDDETQADFVTLLQQAVELLCRYVLWLLSALRVLRLQVVDLRCQANYWQAQHERAREREDDLKERLELARAQIRELERRLYGRKSETAAATQPVPAATPSTPPRKRGQQPGNKGPARRRHEHLPAVAEPCTLPDDQTRCSCCGEPFEEIPGTLDGEIKEIEVRAYRRCYRRQRYRRRCTCPGPRLVAAPPPDKLIPKSTLGISIWVEILCRKFASFTPLYRILADLRSHGLSLASGTIIDGLHKLVPLFEPLYQALVERNRAAEHWHCDETRWLVFVKHPDKAGFCWNLWVFAADDSIVFVLDPFRSHEVPQAHFGDDAQGILNVDRYSAYKAMRQVKSGRLRLSFCWAHVRRDFLEVLTGWHELADWAWSWVEAIAELYQRNDQRLALRDRPTDYAPADQHLRDHVEHIRQRAESEREQPDLRLPQKKVLNSLLNHWQGLTIFVDHPDVPLDNNTAERAHRGPVVARKNFYGSGSLWSGRLAAMLFALFQTIQLGQMNVRCWLTAYLNACAKAHGKPPPDPHAFLPWNMTPDERQQLCLPAANPPNPNPGPEHPPAQPTAA